MIIQSIKPATLHLQFLSKQECNCYLLYGYESPADAECKGSFIRTHYKQSHCLFYMKDADIVHLYRPIRLKKYPKVV